MHLAKRLRANLGLSCCAVGASLSIANALGPATGSAISSSSEIVPAQRPLPTYAITPERQALLNTIRYAEGTWRNGSSQGYRLLYGGAELKSLAKHPDTVVVKRYASAAAGAYQFMPSTWALAAARLKLPDFGPSSQEQAALYLIDQRRALDEADGGKLTPALVAKLSAEWASLPTLAAASFYGQPVRELNELVSFYEENLEELRRHTSRG